MRRIFPIALSASENKLPVINGKETVATVNEEPITMEEYIKALESVHSEAVEGGTAKKVNYSAILGRLITTKLIIQEARNIGLDELPEIEKKIQVYKRQTLQGMLLQRQVRDIEVDDAEVEKIYENIVEEVKLQSAIFEEEDDARKMEGQIRSVGDFEEIAKMLIDSGKAKGSAEGEYTKKKDLQPPVAEALLKMEVGSVSPITRINAGYVIFKLVDSRFPEDQGAREEARKQVLRGKRFEAIEKYYEELRKKYVTADEKLRDSLDFEISAEAFQKLREDKRPLAQIEGEAPVTVGDLARALEEKFFHGVDRAIERKSINKRKIPVLEKIVRKRLLLMEAKREGIDETVGYANAIAAYENSVIFNAFVQKVVAPDIKLKNEELKNYYDGHLSDYSSPGMVRVRSIVFGKRDDAENALGKLRKGTDFGWLAANAEDQVGKESEGLLNFDDNILVTSSLPEGVQKTLSGAKPGDFRLYESPENYFYVLYIQDIFPSKPEPFEKVRGAIAKKIFNDKLKGSVDEWGDKLSEVYEVKIYATDLNN
jgi:parvulin-like peptidyl-prolyl isomerase